MRTAGQEPGAADGGEEFELGGDGEIDEAEGEIEAEGDPDDQGADDAGGEAEGDEVDGDEAPQAQRRVSQHETRWQRREREARETAEENRRLRERLDRIENQRQQPQPDPQAAERAEQEFLERLRLMDPADAAIAVRNRERQILAQALSQIEGRNVERADRSDWRASLTTSPARQRLDAQVESTIAAIRERGDYTTTRETVFYTLYGREVESRARQQSPRQQRAAQRRVAAQTTRPAGGRGEAPRGERRPAPDADEQLLRQMIVADL